jgi:thymidylate synthase (FAD)
MRTELIWSTPNGEELIVYMARVSSSRTEEEKRQDIGKLIKYLLKHKHFSPFEMANMCVKVECTRAVSAQIIRHRSMCFQELSQRYSNAMCVLPDLTLYLKDSESTNRQTSSKIPIPEAINQDVERHFKDCEILYRQLIDQGVSSESARYVLPMATKTVLYINGTVRSWIFYLAQRLDITHVQPEHYEVAKEILQHFQKCYPTICSILPEVMEEFRLNIPHIE